MKLFVAGKILPIKQQRQPKAFPVNTNYRTSKHAFYTRMDLTIFWISKYKSQNTRQNTFFVKWVLSFKRRFPENCHYYIVFFRIHFITINIASYLNATINVMLKLQNLLPHLTLHH